MLGGNGGGDGGEDNLTASKEPSTMDGMAEFYVGILCGFVYEGDESSRTGRCACAVFICSKSEYSSLSILTTSVYL
jgi:ferredoxin-thioredoxin reductase catalytic subunit